MYVGRWVSLALCLEESSLIGSVVSGAKLWTTNCRNSNSWGVVRSTSLHLKGPRKSILLGGSIWLFLESLAIIKSSYT
jgi:hypothetical protein